MKKAILRTEYNYDSVLPVRLRTLMEERKTRQEDLAQICGVARQSIAQWKDGNSRPDIDSLLRISMYYNVSTDYLLGSTEYRTMCVETKAMMEYTGLNEKAIESLHEMSCAEEIIETSYGAQSLSDSSVECAALSEVLSSKNFPYFVGLVAGYIEERLILTRLTNGLSEKMFYISNPKAEDKTNVRDKVIEHNERADLYLFRIQETIKDIVKEIVSRKVKEETESN